MKLFCKVYSIKLTNSPPPPLQREDLKILLLLCTSCPFTNIDGRMYIQKDGVSMGSPLGVLFANFYMSHVENIVFVKKPNLKPNIFCRYVDDYFLLLNSPETLNQIIKAFKEESVLNFHPKSDTTAVSTSWM